MKSILFFIVLLFSSSILSAQINLKKIRNAANEVVSGGGSLSNDEVINGLKEALTVGTNNSTARASKIDGFNKNPQIRIPFPQEAQRVKSTAESMGMKKQVDRFELTLNRAAEEASKEAAPIFIDAIRSMTITDGMGILKGSDDAATRFLNDKTNVELRNKFKPIVRNAIQKVELTKYWNPLMTNYNKVPGVQRINPDLEEYVTLKAIEGLFTLIAAEEMKIRKDPAARVSDLLKKVFG